MRKDLWVFFPDVYELFDRGEVDISRYALKGGEEIHLMLAVGKAHFGKPVAKIVVDFDPSLEPVLGSV